MRQKFSQKPPLSQMNSQSVPSEWLNADTTDSGREVDRTLATHSTEEEMNNVKENAKRKVSSNQAVKISPPVELNDKVYQITPMTYNPSLYILSSLQQNSNKNTLL